MRLKVACGVDLIHLRKGVEYVKVHEGANWVRQGTENLDSHQECFG